jgi:hypothetical protein
MNLSMGNKNVVVGLLVILVYFSMTVFIERTTSMPQFHEKAAAVVVDTKGSANPLDHQVVDIKRGPVYRTGGLYFQNYYPASYVRVPNSSREAGYNMRLYAWMFALFNIAISIIVGIQTRADRRLRAWASWLAVAGVILYPIRDLVFSGAAGLRSARPHRWFTRSRSQAVWRCSSPCSWRSSSLCKGRVRQTPDDGDRPRNRYFNNPYFNRCRRDRTHPSPGPGYDGVHPMMFGLPFATFRLTILSLALLAQIYLFVRARRAIRSSRRSDRFKSRAVGIVGAAICLLFVTNFYILFRPIPWADPPAAAQIILFYPSVVWNLGSLFSALLLFLGQVAGFLVRWAVQLARLLTRLPAPPPSIRTAASCFRPGQAAFLPFRC